MNGKTWSLLCVTTSRSRDNESIAITTAAVRPVGVALSSVDLARFMETSGDEGGDGTINLIHDTVWLVNRSDGRCFPKWPRCHIGKQGENANFHRSPDSGVVPQHMDFEKWYQGPSASTQRCGSHLIGSSVEGALCRETGCGGEQNGGSGLKLASHSGPPLNLRESFGNVFISGTAS